MAPSVRWFCLPVDQAGPHFEVVHSLDHSVGTPARADLPFIRRQRVMLSPARLASRRLLCELIFPVVPLRTVTCFT